MSPQHTPPHYMPLQYMHPSPIPPVFSQTHIPPPYMTPPIYKPHITQHATKKITQPIQQPVQTATPKPTLHKPAPTVTRPRYPPPPAMPPFLISKNWYFWHN
jgi:hypothetical protein